MGCRVLFITDCFGYGGAEKQLALVAEGMFSKGHTIGIINLNQRGKNEGVRNVDKRIKIYTSNIQYRNFLLSNYKYIQYIIHVIREFKPDVLIGFKELANFCVSVTGNIMHIPSLISERADPFFSYKNAKLPRRIKLWLINKATGGIFQSEEASKFYSKSIQSNCAIIPNPIYIKSELPEHDYSNQHKTIVSVGRLDNIQKRLDVMIRSFAIFHANHPEYKLKIYGNGDDEKLVKKWIYEEHLENNIILMGVSDNAVRDINREDIFLITSDFEGISNSLLEAMACGMPVISTDHSPGGGRLLIQNKVNGLLVPCRNPKATSEALSLFAENTELARKCGMTAKQVLEKYSPDKIIDLWENYILNIVNS